MKQLLLRVPEALHRRLTVRAAQEGRSVNSLATELLDATAGSDSRDRRSRLRAAAAAEGMLDRVASAPADPERRRRIIDATRGAGPILDGLLDEERDRR